MQEIQEQFNLQEPGIDGPYDIAFQQRLFQCIRWVQDDKIPWTEENMAILKRFEIETGKSIVCYELANYMNNKNAKPCKC